MTRALAGGARAAAWIAAAAAAAFAFQGCGGRKAGGGAPPPPQVSVVTVASRAVPVPFEFVGRAEGSREIEVRARVSGILLQRKYEEGRAVEQGETLFVIDPAPYQADVDAAEAELAQAQAAASKADREVKRLEPLLAAHAASQKDYDDAVSAQEEAKAGVMSAQARLKQAKLNLGYTRVDAPISGLSSRALKSEGSLVEPGQDSLLTRISQIRPIWVRFSVPDQDLLRLRAAIAAKQINAPPPNALEAELVLADGSVHPERGHVNFSDTLIDPQTGSVEYRAEFANAAGSLTPGQFVRVRLLGIERPHAILVPQVAVQQGQQGRYVFVVDADGKAEMRPVEAGDWVGNDWIIETGLHDGDRVVVEGAQRVRPGSPVTIAGAAGGGAATKPAGAGRE